jgi:hypothetical protein
VFGFISALPEFDPALMELLREEAIQRHQSRRDEFRCLQRELERTVREEQRLVEAIKQGGELTALLAGLKEVQGRKQSLEYDCRRFEKNLPPPVSLPSVEETRRAASRAFVELATDSVDFAAYMRQIIERIVVFPVQLCDGGKPGLRARFEVDLSLHLPEALQLPALEAQLRRELVVDLFEMPQRAAFREQVMAARSQGIPERVIAQQLGLTITAVQRAAALHRMMLRLGLTDPYVPLTGPPADSRRFRRHLHERYRRRMGGESEAA